MSISVAIIGEAMLELSQVNSPAKTNSRLLNMGFGGDTLNTSIYLSRAGINVSYVSALGDDETSAWLLAQWQGEGIDCSLVHRASNSVPGMYMINVDEDGERSFLYWRKNSPASRLFDEVALSESIFDSISKHPYLYLSGISLAILPDASRKRLLSLIKNYRESGGLVIFDGNYRPTLWNNQSQARNAYTQMYQLSDIALPTFEDEAMLFNYRNAEQAIEAMRAMGVRETVMKLGAQGCLSLVNAERGYVAAHAVTPLDTTAAGDSFNAGFLAKRLTGSTISESCEAGHQLASQVIQYKGAIIPRS